MTTRRTFLVTLATGILGWPYVVSAQQVGKVARVGWLLAGTAGPLPPAAADAFRDVLRDGGWVEGRNLIIERRHGPAEGSIDEQRNALAKLATELANLNMDVIFASLAPAAIAAKRVVHTVPIVFAGVSDPVGFGLVASLAKPGGNLTGVSFQDADLNPKRLDLIREAAPGVRKIAAMVDRDHTLRDRMLKDLQVAAQTANVGLYVALTVGTDPNELDRAFDAIKQHGAGAVVGLPVASYFKNRRRIAELSIKHRLPTIFALGDFADAGCLMGYGPSVREMWRLAATYVDAILKGARPADLPVQQPTKFELVVNMNTAKALGLSLAPSLRLRADRVVE